MSTYLDLPSSASFLNFHFIIWTYPQLPVKFILVHLLGLTSEWQFGCALTSSRMLIGLDLHLWCQPCWDSLKTLICLNYLLPFESLSEVFIRCKTLFLFYIPVSDKKTYIYCNVSCNVWLCKNEMSESFRFVFHLNLFYSSFLFPRLNKCEMQMLCPWPCRWNTMIGLTNAICKCCTLTCYWQTLNYWPGCQFFLWM